MHTSIFRRTLLPAALLLSSSTHPASAQDEAQQQQQTENPDCTCWMTGNPSTEPPLQFQHYEFYDFRAIPSEDGNDFTSDPPEIGADQDQGGEEETASYFGEGEFADGWVIQNWDRGPTDDAPVRIRNSAGNIFVSRETPDTNSPTHLTLRTHRNPDFQSTAEFTTAEEQILYASIRVRARISGSPGAVAGLFLYHDARNESDTEILTRDPDTQVRLTNQPGVDDNGEVVPEATADVDVPVSPEDRSARPWSEWNTYRLDWRPELSEWIINNVSVRRSDYGVPTVPSHFHVNMWSDGGVWSDNMTVGEGARLDVQWVELVYNVSGEAEPEGGCEVMCGVDGQEGIASARVDDEGVAAGLRVGWGIMMGAVVAGGLVVSGIW